MVAYLLIGLVVFAEAAIFVGFVLPGETAVVLGGVLASSGRLSLGPLMVLVVAAAVAGDTVGYEVGKHAGPRVLQSRLLRRHRQRLDGARDFLRRRGGAGVFLARFTAFLRAVMPALAGLSEMPYRRFLAFNATGGLVWGVGVTLLGFLAGASYRRVESALGQGGAILLGVLLVGGLFAWHRRRRARPHETLPR
jgi:membrane protein DedA with SNARE-associated domain